jgi:ABC-type dipeptide/oligopeptide/nickel transport system permease component
VVAYIIRRCFSIAGALLTVTFLVFISLHIAPGDPVDLLIPPDIGGGIREEAAARIREQLGLDKPLPQQFVHFIGRAILLDFGRSIRTNRPIIEELLPRLSATLQLALTSYAIAVVLALLGGVLSAVYINSWIDRATLFIALTGVSAPSFWIGLMLMLTFGFYWPILPPSGFGGPIWTISGIRYLVLPAVTLVFMMLGLLTRLTRSSMLDVLSEDYIRTGRAKGVAEKWVILKHGLRNALIPIVTIMGLQIGGLFGGAVVIENVFGWPGMGRYMVGAIMGRDFPAVQASVLILAFIFLLAILISDLAYGVVDPRVRYE